MVRGEICHYTFVLNSPKLAFEMLKGVNVQKCKTKTIYGNKYKIIILYQNAYLVIK